MYKKLLPIFMIFFLLAMPGVSGAQLSPGDFTGVSEAQLRPAHFNDIHGHWAEEEINISCDLGIMNGTGVTAQGYRIFTPEGQVTRAQFAAVLARAFQLDYGQKNFFKEPLASQYYEDVNDQAWYADEVLLCAINDVFDSDGSFYPERYITRIEAAQAIQNSFIAQGITVPMTLMMPQYLDTDSVSHSGLNALIFVSNTGIMKGNAGYFWPEQGLKRGELAKVMNRCAGMIAVNEDHNNREYTLQVGQSFTLSLASNPTTGYQWNFSQPGDENILTLVGESYRRDGDGGQLLMGQGGRNYWTFKALKTGTTDMTLLYARPGESVEPAQTFTLKVTVETPGPAQGGLTVKIKQVVEDSEHMNVDMSIPVISGMKDQQIQSALNTRFEKEAQDLKAELAGQVIAYVQAAEESGFPAWPWQVFSSPPPSYYQNDHLLSLTVDYYQYTGGAHGGTDRRPYNIDLATGQDLALKDLFADGYDYAALINQEIRRQIAADVDGMYFDGVEGFNGISDDQTYYLQDGNLVIYFGQYEIAPYAAGMPEFKIPFSLLQAGLL